MDNLILYIKSAHAQLQKLNNPANPDPSEEQLHSFVKQVVQSFHNLTQNAPAAIKDKIRVQFGDYWDYNGNKPSKKKKMTGLQFEVITSVLMKILEQDKNRMSRVKKEEAEAGPTVPKKFHGEDTTKTLDIPDEKVGRLIGPQGRVLKAIEAASECRVQVVSTSFVFTGPKEGVELGEKIVDAILTKGFSIDLLPEGSVEDTVMVPAGQLPEVLGVGWKNMALLKETYHIEVGEIDNPRNGQKENKPVVLTTNLDGPVKKKDTIVPSKRVPVLLGGKKEDIEEAKKVITQLATMGYSKVTNPDYTHQFVKVEEAMYPRIIGSKGSEIRHIQNSMNVKVTIPSAERGILHEDVLVVGLQENVERAVKYIEKKTSETPAADKDADYFEDDEDLDHRAQGYVINRGN